MDSRSAAPDHSYTSLLVASPSVTTPTANTPVTRSRAASGASTPRQGSSSAIPDTNAPHILGHPDLLATLYPQQSLFRAQLLDYNRLISPGRGGGVSGGIGSSPVLQSSPLPPAVSVPNIQAAPRPRSSSRVSNKGRQIPKQSGNQEGHGNKTNTSVDKSDRAVTAMGKDPASKASNKHVDHGKTSQPRHASQRHSKSPTMPAQASSVPSTPHQRARNFSESREPSPNATQNHSPRSAYSETNSTLPSLPHLGPRAGIGCVYETALVKGRRRMPYSLGTELLDKVPEDKIKSKLSENESRKLTTDMRELYDRLKPTESSKKNREKLVLKLEAIFNNEWPGHKIGVHLFGSSGNKLCSDDSDVDICITTDWKELENVCKIAELLAKRGMKKVVCVSSAKVPIVKIWDPELNLACDMNVNNTLALENTRMILTYVSIDDRVRPLAMVIKYWTRRRIINDAAFGGTLSSYTWICLIIAFLQLRSPPILPALHQLPHKKRDSKSEFADDLDKLRNFGRKNKETLGELLFHFFRFYAHEFDYNKYALSIRLGHLITKTEKKWHVTLNNMLCVEEPFNTVRNLSNTADDTSFRGLHLEIRRAFDLIAEGKVEECFEQYEFPKEEERTWTKPAVPVSRPVMIRASSQQHSGRGGRGGNFRGGNRGFNRNHNNNRRASSSVTYENGQAYPATSAAPMVQTAQELQWWAQQQQFYSSQEYVNSTLSTLQMQEHALRYLQYTQSQQYAQQQALAHAQRMQGSAPQSTDRSRTNSFDNPPLTAPARPELYMYPMSMQSPFYAPQAGFATLPSSPATSSGVPEFRRSLHRTSANADVTSPGSLRSQSQPATRSPMPGGQLPPTSAGYPVSATSQLSNALGYTPQQIVKIPSFIPDEGMDSELEDLSRKASSTASYEDEAGRMMGYYVHEATNSPQQVQANGIPNFGDMGQLDGSDRLRLSTDQLPQSVLAQRMRRTSRSPSPLGHARAFSVGGNTAPLPSMPLPSSSSASKPVKGPLVVNGSASKVSPAALPLRQVPTVENIPVEEPRFENPLRINHGLGINGVHPEAMVPVLPPTSEPVASQPERPVIVNGSSPVVVNGSNPSLLPQNPPDAQSFNQRIAAMNRVQAMAPAPYASVVGNGLPSLPQISPRQHLKQRQQQSGLAPLDLAVADHSFLPDLQHLSPVYENRTPSPTVIRRFDVGPTSAGPSTQATWVPSQLSQTVKDLPKSLPPKPQMKATAESVGGKKEVHTGSSHHPRMNGHAPRENGHVRGAKSENDNAGGWQKQKSRKKAGDGKGIATGMNHGEQMPKHEADRKGG